MTDTKWNSSGAVTFAAGEEPVAAEFNDTLEIGCPPIGTVCGWVKSLTSIPQTLPESWVECDGSTVSDSESPMNGQAVPDLNGSTDADKYFLRGNSSSGSTGGGVSHNHPAGDMNDNDEPGIDSAEHLPPYYEVVFIIRIK